MVRRASVEQASAGYRLTSAASAALAASEVRSEARKPLKKLNSLSRQLLCGLTRSETSEQLERDAIHSPAASPKRVGVSAVGGFQRWTRSKSAAISRRLSSAVSLSSPAKAAAGARQNGQPSSADRSGSLLSQLAQEEAAEGEPQEVNNLVRMIVDKNSGALLCNEERDNLRDPVILLGSARCPASASASAAERGEQVSAGASQLAEKAIDQRPKRSSLEAIRSGGGGERAPRANRAASYRSRAPGDNSSEQRAQPQAGSITLLLSLLNHHGRRNHNEPSSPLCAGQRQSSTADEPLWTATATAAMATNAPGAHRSSSSSSSEQLGRLHAALQAQPQLEAENLSSGEQRLERSWTEFVELKAQADETDGDGGAGNQLLEQRALSLRVQQDAIWELVATELSYIRHLRVVIDLFLSTLLKLQQSSLLLEVDAKRVTSNLAEVYRANSFFWSEYLEPMVAKARATRSPMEPRLMKNAFLQIRNIFQPYYTYCLEHAACLSYIKEQTRVNEQFKAYVDWCESQKECERLRLTDLLAKPMQRLTRYSLLLKAIMKKTDDRKQLCALAQMVAHTDKFVLTVDLELRRQSDLELLLLTARRVSSLDMGLDKHSYTDEVERLVRLHYAHFDLTEPLFNCPARCHRQLLFDSSLGSQAFASFPALSGALFDHPIGASASSTGGAHFHHAPLVPLACSALATGGSIHLGAAGQQLNLGQLKFKDQNSGGKLEVVLLLLTDQLLVCKLAATSHRSPWHHNHHAHSQQQQQQQQQQLAAQPPGAASVGARKLAAQSQQPRACGRPRADSELSRPPPAASHAQPEVRRLAATPAKGAAGAASSSTLAQSATPSPRAFSLVLTQNSDQNLQAEEESIATLQQPQRSRLQVLGGQAGSKKRNSQQPAHHSSASSLIGNAAREFFASRSADASRSGDNSQQLQAPQAQASNAGGVEPPNNLEAPHLRLVRSPYPIERLVMHELKDGQTVYCCQLNDSRTIANSFLLYTAPNQAALAAAAASAAAAATSATPLDLSPSGQQQACSSSGESGPQLASSRTHLRPEPSGENLVGGLLEPPRSRRRSTDARWRCARLTPARQLINLVKQAQVRYQMAAQFHGRSLVNFGGPIQLEDLFPAAHEGAGSGAECPAGGGAAGAGNERPTSPSQARKQLSRLSTWSSFRHSSSSAASRHSDKRRLNSNSNSNNNNNNKLTAQRQDSVEHSTSSGDIHKQWSAPEASAERPSSRNGSTEETLSRPAHQQDPFLKAAIEQHQLMVLNHGQLDELTSCHFEYSLLNDNYLSVLPVATSLSSVDSCAVELPSERPASNCELGAELRNQTLDCSQLLSASNCSRNGSQGSVFEWSTWPTAASGAQPTVAQATSGVYSSRERLALTEEEEEPAALLTSVANRQQQQQQSRSAISLLPPGGASCAANKQLLSPNRYNRQRLGESHSGADFDRFSAQQTVACGRQRHLSRSARLTTNAELAQQQQSALLDQASSSDTEARCSIRRSALQVRSPVGAEPSDKSQSVSSSSSSTRSSSPLIGSAGGARNKQPAAGQAHHAARRKSWQMMIESRQQQRLLLLQKQASSKQEASLETETSAEGWSWPAQVNDEPVEVNSKDERENSAERRKTSSSRRNLSSLRRQNVIISASNEQQRQASSNSLDGATGPELQTSCSRQQQPRLVGKHFLVSALGYDSGSTTDYTTTSGPSTQTSTATSAANCPAPRKAREPTEQPAAATLRHSSQATTYDQSSVLLDETNAEELLSTVAVGGQQPSSKARSFELGNLSGGALVAPRQSAELRSSSFEQRRAQVSVTLTLAAIQPDAASELIEEPATNQEARCAQSNKSALENSQANRFAHAEVRASNKGAILGKLRRIFNLNLESARNQQRSNSSLELESGVSSSQVPVLNVTKASPQRLELSDSGEATGEASGAEEAQRPMKTLRSSFEWPPVALEADDDEDDVEAVRCDGEWRCASAQSQPESSVHFLRKCQHFLLFSRGSRQSGASSAKSQSGAFVGRSESADEMSDADKKQKRRSAGRRKACSADEQRASCATNSDHAERRPELLAFGLDAPQLATKKAHNLRAALSHESGLLRCDALNDVDSFVLALHEHEGVSVVERWPLEQQSTALASLEKAQKQRQQQPAYLGFHEKLSLHARQVEEEERALRRRRRSSSSNNNHQTNRRKQLNRQFCPEARGEREQSASSAEAAAGEPQASSPFKLRGGRLKSQHFEQQQQQQHWNTGSCQTRVKPATLERTKRCSASVTLASRASRSNTAKALSLTRSMTGDIFVSLLRATSLLSVSAGAGTAVNKANL